ncbi:hypothetical protein Mro02_29470 [Microbispora rosea subsp. aerata]|nr:hypothetical protein Mro02_29470 [Microbispora rosea subsp. aerata]GLJ86634.1 hypothetical protein GCM10017588_53720 [Microbispora rosea subsp. aerata]
MPALDVPGPGAGRGGVTRPEVVGTTGATNGGTGDEVVHRAGAVHEAGVFGLRVADAAGRSVLSGPVPSECRAD